MSDHDPIIQHGPFDEEAALAFLRKHAKGRHIYAHAGVWLPIEGDPSKGFEGIVNVRITRQAAERFIRDLLQHLGKRGARLRFSMSSGCLFIGSSC